MDILRTPDARFDCLPDFPFAPRYTSVTDKDGTEVRIHHIEEGPADGPVVVMMHGNPTWSYIHRHMVPKVAAAGFRVLAPDLVGCGRSDKPARKTDYTFARHVDWMTKWFKANDLTDITLFCQDWGGMIALTVLAENPEMFARVVAANTGLATGEGESEFMKMWVNMMAEATTFPWDMLTMNLPETMTDAEKAAYTSAPFPSDDYMAGILQFPVLIPVQPDNPGVPQAKAAWEYLKACDKPFLTLFGRNDAANFAWQEVAVKNIPGAQGLDHQVIEDAGHFVQEGAPAFLSEQIVEFYKQTS